MKSIKKKIINPEIRLIAVLAILLALSVAMIGLKITNENELSASAEHLDVANSIAHRLNEAAALQAKVRGLGATLIGSKIQSQEMLDEFVALGNQSDQMIALAIQQGEVLFSESGDLVLLENLNRLKVLNRDFKLSRKKLLEQGGELAVWMNMAISNIEQAYRLRTVVFSPTNQREALLLYNNIIRANAATLADYAGRERALLGHHIAIGKPIDDKTIKVLESYRAIVEMLSNEILLIKSLTSTPDALVQVITAYEEMFLGEYQQLREDIYQQSLAYKKIERNLTSQIGRRAGFIELNIKSIFHEFISSTSGYAISQLAKALATGDASKVMEASNIVEDYFEILAKRNRHHLQLRILDATGQERVRVEVDKGQVRRVLSTKLQDKSEKAYFIGAITQQPNGLYVSPYDLNMEFGKIEKPYRPTMRIAAPIYFNNKVQGVVVINFDPLENMLDGSAVEKNGLSDSLLVDKQGYYLLHPDAKKEWGMMPQLKQSHFNIKQEVPAFADEILSGERGIAVESWGLMYAWSPIRFNPTNKKDYWVLVTTAASVDYPVDSSEWFVQATKGIQSAMAISEVVGKLSANAVLDIKEKSTRSIMMQYFMLVLAIISFGFITIMVRISQQVALQLQQSKEIAEQANKSKSEFLSSMSHELRTPMNAILGFSQLLTSDQTEPLTKGQKENVGYIFNAGKHLMQLINQVLELSKIEAGKLDIDADDIELQLVIHEAIMAVRPMADNQNIKIELLGGYVKHCVIADETRIKQVLINLISNAVKYNVQGGAVTIVCDFLDADKVRISISDTGIGIAEDKLDNLYEPFDRLGAESSNIEGTGIGLTITKYLVGLMGGKISVKSQPGTGSTFSVDLPRSDKIAVMDEAQEKILAMPVPAKHDYSIVYIEDNNVNLMLMQQILKPHTGISLFCATNGNAGIELIRECAPDLVLLDLGLPDMDGYAVLDVLKQDAKTADIPVIAVTAKATAHDIEAGLEAGFVEYVTKPINVAHFIKVIDRMAGRSERPEQ